MSNRKATWLAWSLWLIAMTIGVLKSILDAMNRHMHTAPLAGDLAGVAGLTVGALIVSRHPSNRIGWLFLLCSLSLAFGGYANFADQYALYTFVTRPGALPAGEWVAWLGLITQIIGFSPLVTFLPLLFPDGRPPSPRWRPVVWAATIQLAVFIITAAISPRLDSGLVDIPNPLGLEVFGALSRPVTAVSTVAGVALMLLSVASVFVRFRRARGDERQQLKWFAFAAAFIPLVAAVAIVAGLLNWAWLDELGPWQLSVAAIPIGTGIAIFKHRLYEIDLIIRRTLIYSVLTALLAFAYFGSVVVLQGLFAALGGQRSEVITVVSTLAIAALFVPLRRRVQNLIDRRFYRRKYDAAQVLAQFAATARDEVDLQALTEGLLDVVDEAMQPTHVSLWLRDSSATR